MNSTKTESKDKKQSAFDLSRDMNQLKHQFEDKLRDTEGEITEELEEIYQQMDQLSESIIDKITAYQWVKRKLEAEVAAWDGRYKYWKDVAEIDKNVREARKNNVDNLKGRVVMLLRSLDEEFVRIDGKKVYLRDYYKVNITDEEKAYTYLQGFDLASKEVVVDEESYNELLGSLFEIQETIQGEDGSPLMVPAEITTATGRIIELLQNSHTNYKFETYHKLSAHAKELHQTELKSGKSARQRLDEINDLLDAGADTEDQEKSLLKERDEITAYLDKVRQDHSIPGAEVEISKSVFGL